MILKKNYIILYTLTKIHLLSNSTIWWCLKTCFLHFYREDAMFSNIVTYFLDVRIQGNNFKVVLKRFIKSVCDNKSKINYLSLLRMYHLYIKYPTIAINKIIINELKSFIIIAATIIKIIIIIMSLILSIFFIPDIILWLFLFHL